MTLEYVRPAGRGSTVLCVVKHVQAAATADVNLTKGHVLPATPGIMDISVISSVKDARTLVVIRMEPAIIALIQIYMD